MSKYSFTDYIKPHRNFIVSLKILFFLTIVFSLFRILFYLYQYKIFSSIPIKDIFESFLIGIRFDLSAIMMFSSIFLILLNLPGKFKFSKIYFTTILSLFFLVVLITILILAGDIYYYDFAKRRLSYEIFNIFKSIPELFIIIVKNYLLAFIVFIILIFLIGYIWFKFLSKTKIKNRNNIANDLLYFFITAAIVLILIRGGFQLKPLRESYAFRNENISLGHLSLNPVFTVIRTLNRGNVKDVKFMDDKESIEIVRGLLKDENENFVNDEYPLMRLKTFSDNRNQANVVIIVMESWPGDILELKGNSVTPFFNKLTKEGKYFKKFFASGQRTIQGIQAIVGSIPNVVYDDILGSPIEQHSLRQLGTILKESGYNTIFIHGARRGSMGFEAYSKLAGFNKYVSREDFDLTKVKDDGTWGIFDHFVFERANLEFEKSDKPFMGLIISLSSHAPYTLPSKEFEYYDSTVADYKLLNALRYSDWSLEYFFSNAIKSSYFKNTIFIITADHAEGTREKNIYELFNIPCLIYAPDFVEAGIVTNVCSQVDILPTIIDLLKIETTHSSFGKSMFSGKNGFAFFSTGSLFGWVKGDWLLIGDYDKSIGLYNISIDKELFMNKLQEEQHNATIMRKEMLAYLQTATSVLKSNKLYKVYE